jgi:hypothetical protein
VIAGALPLAVGWIRDTGRDKRDAAERLRQRRSELAQTRREQCVRLLRLTRDFRVLVENTCDSSGPDLDANAEEVRQSAAGIASQADEVEFMIPQIAAEALSLAEATRAIAALVTKKENRELGSSLVAPDFTGFGQCLEKFKQAAQDADRGPGTEILGGSQELLG